MRSVLLIVVLTSVCKVHAGSRCCVPIQPGFDDRQLYGKWYPIAVVMDRDIKRAVEVISSTVEFPTHKGLIVISEYYRGHGCLKIKGDLWHTKKPGEFKIYGDAFLRIVELVPGSYCISHIEGPDYKVMYLYSRRIRVSSAVKEKYKKYVTSLNFPENKIYYLNPSDRCPV